MTLNRGLFKKIGLDVLGKWPIGGRRRRMAAASIEANRLICPLAGDLFPRLFCRLLLLCFLLFSIGLLRCSSLRIKPALLFRRAIALAFVIELLVSVLLILRIGEHADALG